MNNNPYRYEIKMVADALYLGEVRSWVFTHPNAFQIAYPPRQVNNIYFDTRDRDLMKDHINGAANREKFRFRWYGESWLANGGQIEIKKKRGMLGYKTTQKIIAPMDIARLNWGEIAAALKQECTHEFTFLVENLIPVLINHYQREYYISMDGRIRVTLDYQMRAFEQAFGLSPNLKFPQLQLDNVIIEMKAAEADHARIANSLAQFPLRCTQNSKYLNGLGAF
ncbi:MAG: polyphosphate polymerase domain-containing protein [Chloroflexi bacterium]|nr:polyphosphate polymerase domain-containing protein [Chloroflexota bacterium]